MLDTEDILERYTDLSEDEIKRLVATDKLSEAQDTSGLKEDLENLGIPSTSETLPLEVDASDKKRSLAQSIYPDLSEEQIENFVATGSFGEDLDEVRDEVRDEVPSDEVDKTLSDKASEFLEEQSAHAKLNQFLFMRGMGITEEDRDDFIKSVVNQGFNAYEVIAGGIKEAFDQFETKEEKLAWEKKLKREKPNVYGFLLSHLLNPSGSPQEKANVAFDPETGRPIQNTLSAPLVAETAPFLLAGAQAAKLLPKGKALGTAAIIGTEVTLYNLLTNREDNVVDLLADYMPTQEAFNAVKNAITANDLSESEEKQAKLAFESAILASPGVFLIVPAKLVRYATDFAKKPWVVLTEEEKAEALFKSYRQNYKETVEQASRRTKESGVSDPADLLNPETGEPYSKIGTMFRNVYAGFVRMTNQFFTSEGYLPSSVYKDKAEFLNKHKSILNQAGNLATRLDTSINKLAGLTESSPEDVKNLVFMLLRDQEINVKIMGDESSREAFIKAVQSSDVTYESLKDFPGYTNYSSLPDEVIHLVADARESIDSLSMQILDLDVMQGDSKEIRAIIEENIGKYVNRAYRIHQGGWSPSRKAVADAVDYLATNIQETRPKVSAAAATEQAEKMVDSILRAQELQHFTGANREALSSITDGVLKKKADIPVEIRNLLGEITDPSEVLLNTLSKMSYLVAQHKFFQSFLETGTKSNILYKASDKARDKSIFTHRIEGTNSSLDGMFTTPEIGLAIKNRETALTPLLGQIGSTQAALGNKAYVYGASAFVATAAELKGITQKFKTVYNPLSHLRNTAGAFWMLMSNGSNPFNRSATTSFLTLLNKKKGGYEDLYNEALELGILGTNVRLQEFKEILEEYKTVIDADVDATVGIENFYKSAKRIFNKASVGTTESNQVGLGDVLAKGDEFISKAYMAEDDFFKLWMYVDELETLKSAYKDDKIPLEDLKKEAARKVRAVMPNYDLVPKGVKSTRNIPFIGAFISFPSEIIRTSFNTVELATQEILTGNATLKARGLRRLAGFGILAGAGSTSIEKLTASQAGLSEQQLVALKEINRNEEWGEQLYAFSREEDENGNVVLYSYNLTYTDPRTTIIAPFHAAASAFANGRITEEEYENRVAKATKAFVVEAVKPFVSETILNQAVFNFASTVANGKRLPGSSRSFHEYIPGVEDEERTFSQRLSVAAENFLYDAGPGVFKDIKLAVDISNEERRGIFNEIIDGDLAASKYFTTMDKKPINIKKSIYEKVRRYSQAINRLRPTTYSAEKVEDIVNEYKNLNNEVRSLSEELYLKINAGRLFYDDSVSESGKYETFLNTLEKEYGSEVGEVIRGYTPVTFIDSDSFWNRTEKLRLEGKLPSSNLEFRKAIAKLNGQVSPERGTRLDFRRNIPETGVRYWSENQEDREEKAVGGTINTTGAEVVVPNAPIEPDERIDRMTGLPYDVQAGIPFIDEEDPLKRLGLSGGGTVAYVDPLERLGFATGSVVKTPVDFPFNTKDIVKAFKYVSDSEGVDSSILFDRKDDAERVKFVAGGALSLGKAIIKAKDEFVDYLNDVDDVDEAVAKAVDKAVDDDDTAKSLSAVVDMSDATLKPYEEVPEPATYEKMYDALKSNQKEKINVKIPDGERVGLRLDIDAYTKYDTWVPTLHPRNGKTSHRATVAITNVDLMPTKREQEKAQEILKGEKNKSPFARIDGDLVNRTDEENYRLAQEALTNPEWTQVGFNPDRHSYFFDRATGDPVVGGEEAIQVGPLVLVKNAVFSTRDKFKYVEGGHINFLERVGLKEGSEVTGKVTLAGRPVFKNKKGEVYSELTTTLQLEKNKWVTFPTVDEKGESLSDAKVMKYLKENGPIDPITGEEFPVFENEKEASEYARRRTKVLLDN